MSVSIDIEIKCTKHSTVLDADLVRGEIFVEPCEDCLEEARTEGRDEGL